MNLTNMSDALARNLQAAQSVATRRAYAGAVAAFRAWAGDDMPAEPQTVAEYLSRLGETASHSTVRQHAAAIAAAHRDAGLPTPTNDAMVRRALAGHARRTGVAAKQAAPLDAEAFEAITATAMQPRITRGGRMETTAEAQFRGLVDCCLIGLMRDALLRRSEAAAARWADLHGCPDGSARLAVRRSKTDQEGRGTIRYVSPDITETLNALRIITNPQDETQPIFGIKDRQICRRIADAARQAGLRGSFSGHSPRVGMAQDLARFGIALPALMQAGGWKSPNMPATYIRAIEAGTGAVATWYASNE